jgi:hypothetical protein
LYSANNLSWKEKNQGGTYNENIEEDANGSGSHRFSWDNGL